MSVHLLNSCVQGRLFTSSDSVKPCASSRISWIPRTSMLLIRSLISAKTKKSYFIDILTLRESIISLADAFPLFRYVPSPSETCNTLPLTVKIHLRLLPSSRILPILPAKFLNNVQYFTIIKDRSSMSIILFKFIVKNIMPGSDKPFI